MAEMNQYRCEECNANFKTQQELDEHNRNIHQKNVQEPPEKKTA